MTILYSVFAPEGIVFAADTMLTRAKGSGTLEAGTAKPKVFRIPKTGLHSRGALLGYYGLAEVGGRQMGEFIKALRDKWRGGRSLAKFADHLIEELERADKRKDLRRQIVGFHLGGFESYKDRLCPVFYYVRNGEADESTGVYQIFQGGQLKWEEQLMGRTLEQWQPQEARRALLHWQRQNGIPLWFRNGDLGAMAGPTAAIELAARYLAARPQYRWPRSLPRWRDLTESMVDTTASLVQAMYTQGTPTIGGRAVSESLPWPGL